MVFHNAAAAYTAFAVAAGLIVITPGLDTALVLRTAASDGPVRAAAVASGACCGVLIWGSVVAAGLGMLLAASQFAYTALRWVGAAYLVYIGAMMLLRPHHGVAPVLVERGDRRGSSIHHFVRGLLSDLLNPKIGVFYVTFLPQFVPIHSNAPRFILTLAGLQAAEGALWFALLLTATRPILRWLQRPSVIRTLDRLTGGVLLGFGLELALRER